MGGFRDITFVVKGDKAWGRFKYEGGPHRVQRVPATESQGRIHTSAATVAVLPEAEEVDVEIDPNDLEIDVFRATGPGGQSVNTTDSAVRITHKPTGLVVSCQDEKSQLQNKDKAMRILRSRLLQIEQERQHAELSAARREQVKGGGRSEKIRTYNYKENRVTDHRIGLTVHALDRVLGGDLDEIVDALAADERTRQLGRIVSRGRSLARRCATEIAARARRRRHRQRRHRSPVHGRRGVGLRRGGVARRRGARPRRHAPRSRLRRMCERRVRGEPLQYVLGAWSFRGLDLHGGSRGC